MSIGECFYVRQDSLTFLIYKKSDIGNNNKNQQIEYLMSS
jgi:hypothetical protein